MRFSYMDDYWLRKIISKNHGYILSGLDLGGSFHCRCEQTQIQQAQYNEFGREAGLRTEPLWGCLQRSGGIIGELDRQQRGWGKGQSSSSVLSRGWFFFFPSSDTPPIELPGVFRIALPFFVKSLWLYILLFSSSWPSICRLRRSLLECLSHPAIPSTCCEW